MARQAAQALTQVHVGDVEKMDLPYHEDSFDALIMSEVLEHLVEPDVVLTRLVRLVKPGGLVLASSPNIAHWKPISELILGRFEYPGGRADGPHSCALVHSAVVPEHVRRGRVVLDEVRPSRRSVEARNVCYSECSVGGSAHLAWGQMNLQGHRASTVSDQFTGCPRSVSNSLKVGWSQRLELSTDERTLRNGKPTR